MPNTNSGPINPVNQEKTEEPKVDRGPIGPVDQESDSKITPHTQGSAKTKD